MRRDILASKDELRSLKDRLIHRPFDAIYDMLRKRCAMTLESAPVTEAQWRALAGQGDASAALKAARVAQGRIIDLLAAHNIDPNTAYRERAVEELKNLLSWTTWHEPAATPAPAPTTEGTAPTANHEATHVVDLCTAEAAVAAVIALDWLHDEMTEIERLRVVHALRHRVIMPYRQAVAAKAWWYTSYDSSNAVINAGCGLAALALSDEEPAAREAYQLARAGLKHFLDALGREGGWDEGLAYWGYAMRYVLMLGEAASRTIDDQSIFHSRGMDTTGQFPVYFTPSGRYAGFGDTPTIPLYGALYLLVKHYGAKELCWWLDHYAFHRDVTTTDWSTAGLALLWRPTDAEVPTVPSLQPLKVFNEIGWAAIGDVWPTPSLYVSTRTGDLSASHSHVNMCSLNLLVDGQAALSDLGLPPYELNAAEGPHGEFFQLRAACHNTVLVGRRDHFIDAQGSILEAQTARNYRWVACDAGIACGENVHYVRHVIMVVRPQTQEGRCLVVLDEIQNTAAETVDLFWHTPGRVTPSDAAGSGAGTVDLAGGSMRYALAASAPLLLSVLPRKLGHRAETVLHAQLAPTPRAAILSVFSREAIRGKIELRRAVAGDLTLKVGALTLRFKSSKKHLQLQDVTE